MARPRKTCDAATILLGFGAVACTTVDPAAPVLRSAARAATRQVEVTPCLWVAGLDGDLEHQSSNSYDRVPASFSDDFDDSDWTGMVTVVVPLDRWTIFGDAARVQRSSTSPLSEFGSQKSVDLEQQIYGLSVGYRITESGDLDVDVLAGVRYTFVDANLDITDGYIGAPPFGIVVPGTSARDDVGWIDAIVGTRLVYRFADRWAVVGQIDAGGGGSQFTMQGIASVDFDLSSALTAKFGYRHLYSDADAADLQWQMHTSGFFLGMGIRF